MEFKEYQEKAKRTLPNLHTKYFSGAFVDCPVPAHMLNIVHTRLGIVSEIEELIIAIQKKDTVNIGEELGDMLWYIANDLTICKASGFLDSTNYEKFTKTKFGKPMSTDGGYMVEEGFPWLSSITKNSSALCDDVKKYLAYGKSMDLSKYIKNIDYLLGAVNNTAMSFDVNLEEYMDKNTAKLMGRYPEKFTEEAAINRDTDNERKILEG